MSFDISLFSPEMHEHYAAKACPPWEEDKDFEHRCPGDAVEVGNYTYNVAPMWHDAMGGIERPDPEHAGRTLFGIRLFHGAPCVEAAGPLRAACERMESNPDHYRAMNPPNGWGDYESALRFLRNMTALVVENPTYRIHIT